MMDSVRRVLGVLALLSAGLVLAACGRGGTQSSARDAAAVVTRPERILAAPKSLLAAAQPQPDGTIWALAGTPSTGLFELDASTGKVLSSVSVSKAARSVAETSSGVIGVALGTDRAGALELLNGRTRKVIQTVLLPAPARQVVVGSNGTTFYVLNGWAGSASVTIVSSRNGKVQGSVPVPVDAVSMTPDIQGTALYVLQKTGLVDVIGISGGKISAQFKVGPDGEALALSPDNSTLYVLKGTSAVSNVAVVTLSTESVHRVLSAPSHCLELLLSPSGRQLYDVVGAASFGNIQIFAA
jgi:DNA-binding beta-propeller fold protein YncE